MAPQDEQDDAAARLEAALERIALLAAQPKLAAKAIIAQNADVTARLDAVIERMHAALNADPA
ncbi:MAG: hypothetical protein KGJ41_09715 [Rhodospirillales bacterium]|nr:hypothetical protein [Rhodospirillales bacterium]MDE2199290.1 hypothetical protein [Rhodospirillales bacterium]MDE2575355.1 hypothetical protein [Rhodospirillales bacterium]